MSLSWLVPEFVECWWDSLFIDFLGANIIGMAFGAIIVKLARMKSFNWVGDRVGKLGMRFMPLYYEHWRITSIDNVHRVGLILIFVGMTTIGEANTFFLMHACSFRRNLGVFQRGSSSSPSCLA